MTITENNIADMGQISNIAYRTLGAAIFEGRVLSGDFIIDGKSFSLDSAYTVIDYADMLTGMQAVLFEKNDVNGTGTGEYVIAFRGTETSSSQDILADILTGTHNINPQVSSALSLHLW